MCDDLDLNPVNFVPAITAAINQQVVNQQNRKKVNFEPLPLLKKEKKSKSMK